MAVLKVLSEDFEPMVELPRTFSGDQMAIKHSYYVPQPLGWPLISAWWRKSSWESISVCVRGGGWLGQTVLSRLAHCTTQSVWKLTALSSNGFSYGSWTMAGHNESR